jgi:hypothetical protein
MDEPIGLVSSVDINLAIKKVFSQLIPVGNKKRQFEFASFFWYF